MEAIYCWEVGTGFKNRYNRRRIESKKKVNASSRGCPRCCILNDSSLLLKMQKKVAVGQWVVRHRDREKRENPFFFSLVRFSGGAKIADFEKMHFVAEKSAFFLFSYPCDWKNLI